MVVSGFSKKTNDQAEGESGSVSRRELFRTAVALTGSAAIFAVGVASTSARADAAKMSKTDALYQDKPKAEQSCANCALFIAPASCGVVDGVISPSGWCKLYQKKG